MGWVVGGVWYGEGVFCHRGVQLILAYSWARLAILVAGKGRRGMFLFLLFLNFHSCTCFFPVPLIHLCLFSPFLWEMTQNDPYGMMCCQTPNSINQSILFFSQGKFKKNILKCCLLKNLPSLLSIKRSRAQLFKASLA